MKPKLLSKKLALKKETITALNFSDQNKVLAGAVGTGGGGELTFPTCDSYVPTCWKTCDTNCTCYATCDGQATCCTSIELCSC